MSATLSRMILAPATRRAWLGLALLTACASPPALPVPATPATEMPTPLVLGAELDGPTPAREKFGKRGRYRVVHTSACLSSDRTGGPLVWPDRSAPPTAGAPTRVQWTTTPSAPYPQAPAVLLMSLGDVTPIPLGAAGLPGCALHVDTNPRNLFAFTPGTVPWLTQDGGRVWLHWTPPASFAGVELNMQLVVYSPGANDAGWLTSPGLELWVGSGK